MRQYVKVHRKQPFHRQYVDILKHAWVLLCKHFGKGEGLVIFDSFMSIFNLCIFLTLQKITTTTYNRLLLLYAIAIL